MDPLGMMARVLGLSSEELMGKLNQWQDIGKSVDASLIAVAKRLAGIEQFLGAGHRAQMEKLATIERKVDKLTNELQAKISLSTREHEDG